MSKFLLNLLLQIFKALVNSKNPIFNSEIHFFLIFGPADPAARLASGPASPLAAPLPAGQKRPAGPSSPRVSSVFTGNTFSFSDRAFPSRPPYPFVTATRAPPVGFIISTAPPTPVGIFPAPLPCASDAPERLQPSHITSPS
jgi:hypothetical protein